MTDISQSLFFMAAARERLEDNAAANYMDVHVCVGLSVIVVTP